MKNMIISSRFLGTKDMINLLFVCFLCITLPLAGQVNLDSLKTVWNDSNQPDTSRAMALHKIAWKGYLFSQPDSAYYFAQLQYELAQSKGLTEQMAIALNTQGVSYYVKNDYQTAIDYFKRSLSINEESGDLLEISRSLNNLGLAHAELGDLTTALNHYIRSLTIKEEIGNKRGIASSLNNIGMIYEEQGNFSSALDYYNRSLNIFEEIGDQKGVGTSSNNIGIIYEEQGNSSKAIDYYTRSLKVFEGIGYDKGAAYSLNNIGVMYCEQGDLAQALNYTSQSLKIREKIGDKKGIASCLNNYGNIYKAQEDYESAISYSSSALSIAQENGATVEARAAAFVLYECYSSLGNYSMALKMYELYIRLRDSILSEQNQEEIIRLEYKYAYEKQVVTDKIQAAEAKKLVALKLNRYKKFRNVSVVIAFLLLIVASLIYLSYYRKGKMNILLAEKNKQILQSSLQLAELNTKLEDEVLIRTEELRDANINLLNEIEDRNLSDKALRESEKFLKSVVENIPNMIFVKDAKHLRFVRINSAGEKLLGYRSEELIGKNDYDFFPKQEADFFTTKDLEVLNNKELIDIFEEPIQTKDMGERILHTMKIPILDEEGNPQYLLGISEDITERKKAEKALKKSEQLNKTVIENSPLGISVRDLNGTLLLSNKAWQNLWGFCDKEIARYKEPREELVFNEKDSYLGGHLDKVKELYDNGGEYYIPELKLSNLKKNKAEWISQYFYAIRDERGDVQRVVILTEDITERKKTDELKLKRKARSLRQKSAITRLVFNKAINSGELNTAMLNLTEEISEVLQVERVGIWFLSEDEREMYNIEQYDNSRKRHSKGDILISQNYPRYWKAIRTESRICADDAQNDSRTNELNEELLIPKGISSILDVGILVEGKLIGVMCLEHVGKKRTWFPDERAFASMAGTLVAQTIINSERKKAEEQILQNLKEKTILLQEIYHRTRNNMAVITGMLTMHTRRTNNKEIKNAFLEMNNKIKAMSLVHEKLYKAKDLSRINLKEYLEELTHQIRESYSHMVSRLSLKLQLEDTLILIDSAVPLGLIMDELITNIFKHAFPNEMEGEICLKLVNEPEGEINIYLSDNGIGIGDEMDLRKECSLGLETMFSLIDYQLKGEVTYTVDNGLNWHIRFKNNLDKVRI